MEDTSFKIQLPLFEGPFDLLLFFIKQDEIPIDEVRISKITDDFLHYIKQMKALNVALASEFILTAATLMEIKAKTLLPRSFQPDVADETDPEQDFLKSLALYSKFKELAEKMKNLENQRSMQHARGNIDTDIAQMNAIKMPGEALQYFDLYKLLMVYQKLQQKYQLNHKDVRHTIIQYPYTIEQQKKAIQYLVSINEKIDCCAIMKSSDNKVQFVYNLLAILELLQQEDIALILGEGYNNFWISTKDNNNNIHLN